MRRVELARTTLAPLRGSSRRVVLGLGLGLATAVSTVTLAASSAWLIVRAAGRPPVFTLTFVMGLVQLTALAKAASRYLERLATHDAAMGVLLGVRRRVFEAVARLVPGARGLRSDVELVATATEDVDLLEHLYVGVLPPLLVAAVAGLGTAVVAGILDPWSGAALASGLAALVVLPGLGVVASRAAAGRVELARLRRLELVDRLAASALELSTGPGLAATTEELAQVERSARAAELTAARWRGLVAGLGVVVSGGTVACLALRSADLVRGASLSADAVAVMSLMAVAVLELVASTGPAVLAAPRDLAAARRVAELELAAATWPEPELATADVSQARSLELEGVALGYGEPIVSGADLSLGPGARVAVTGRSGSGKSTLAKLLARFVPPLGGAARLGGEDLDVLLGSQVRSRVVLAGAEPHLFDATLAANLRMARPGASDAELMEALGHVGLLARVTSDPLGLELEVGPRGSRLSGGERQRVGLARALLSPAPIVVLDEPTAGLDEQAAADVLGSLQRELGERALLLVGHRERDAASMDQHLELSAGRLHRLS